MCLVVSTIICVPFRMEATYRGERNIAEAGCASNTMCVNCVVAMPVAGKDTKMAPMFHPGRVKITPNTYERSIFPPTAIVLTIVDDSRTLHRHVALMQQSGRIELTRNPANQRKSFVIHVSVPRYRLGGLLQFRRLSPFLQYHDTMISTPRG